MTCIFVAGCGRPSIPSLPANEPVPVRALVQQLPGRLGESFDLELEGQELLAVWQLYVAIRNDPDSRKGDDGVDVAQDLSVFFYRSREPQAPADRRMQCFWKAKVVRLDEVQTVYIIEPQRLAVAKMCERMQYLAKSAQRSE